MIQRGYNKHTGTSVTELDVLLLGLSLFRSDIEKLQRVIRSVSIKYVISVHF